MHTYTVTLEAYNEEFSRRVKVDAFDEYDAMATAQIQNPGWHPVDSQREMNVSWLRGAK